MFSKQLMINNYDLHWSLIKFTITLCFTENTISIWACKFLPLPSNTLVTFYNFVGRQISPPLRISAPPPLNLGVPNMIS